MGMRNKILACIALIIVNPVTYMLATVTSISQLTPDSAAYFALADQLWTNGKWYLEGWGHVDHGLLLPPLYPFLTGLLARFIHNEILAAYLTSAIAMQLSAIPIFFLLRRRLGAFLALCALAVIEIHPTYIFHASAPLTEGLFMAQIIFCLYLIVVHEDKQTKNWLEYVIVGVIAATPFFTRQIGVFFFLFLCIFWLVESRSGKELGANGGWPAKKLILAGFGASLLIMPYALSIKLDSGSWPIKQSFRLGHYQVYAHHGAQLTESHAGHTGDYLDLYKQRRDDLRLTPDGSEMVGFLIPEQSHAKVDFWGTLRRWANNLLANAILISDIIGPISSALLVVSFLTVVFLREREKPPVSRMVAMCIATYFLFLSLLVGSIYRYIEILFPVIAMLVFLEIYRLSVTFISWIEKPVYKTTFGMLMAAFMISSMPLTLFSLPRTASYAAMVNELARCMPSLAGQQPVFALHPLYAYLAGGTYRVLPNAPLDDIIDYGQKTGVHWLVMAVTSQSEEEGAYYEQADWLANAREELGGNPRVEIACRTAGDLAVLYKLKNVSMPADETQPSVHGSN